MAMTRAQAHLQVKRYLNEPENQGDEGFISEADINNWIPSAQFKVRRDLPEENMQSEFTVNVLTTYAVRDNNVIELTVPSNFKRFESLTVYPTGTNGTPYRAALVNRKRFDHERVNCYSSAVQTTTGGFFCTVIQDKILVTPKDSNFSTSSVFNLTYLPVPTTPSSDSSYLDVPEEGEELVCLWVAVLCAIKAGNTNLSDKLKAMYSELLAGIAIRGMTTRTQKSLPPETEAKAAGT